MAFNFSDCKKYREIYTQFKYTEKGRNKTGRIRLSRLRLPALAGPHVQLRANPSRAGAFSAPHVAWGRGGQPEPGRVYLQPGGLRFRGPYGGAGASREVTPALRGPEDLLLGIQGYM